MPPIPTKKTTPITANTNFPPNLPLGLAASAVSWEWTSSDGGRSLTYKSPGAASYCGLLLSTAASRSFPRAGCEFPPVSDTDSTLLEFFRTGDVGTEPLPTSARPSGFGVGTVVAVDVSSTILERLPLETGVPQLMQIFAVGFNAAPQLVHCIGSSHQIIRAVTCEIRIRLECLYFEHAQELLRALRPYRHPGQASQQDLPTCQSPRKKATHREQPPKMQAQMLAYSR